MEWLNISVTQLNSREFKLATSAQIGTWIRLLSYCAQQENSGRIEGFEEYADEAWLTVIGVTKSVTRELSPLWSWIDTTLVVHAYPTEKESLLRDRREFAKRGGSSRSEIKQRSAAINGAKHNPSKTEATTEAKTEANAKHNPSKYPSITQATTQQKGKEKEKEKEKEKGKEKDRADSPPFSKPSLESWSTHARTVHPDWPEEDVRAAWAHYEAAGWHLSRGRRVHSWQACVETCHARWRKQAGKKVALAEPTFDPTRPHAYTGGLEVVNESASVETGGAT